MKKFLLTFAVAMTAMFATAQTKTYTDALSIELDGETMPTQQSTIIVKQESNGTYTLSLNDFIISADGMYMPVGNIVVGGISATTENGIKSFTTEQNITITEGSTENDWLGPILGELPVSISGKMTEGSLFCNIRINMDGNTINVVFGSDILKTFSYEEELTVTVDGEGTAPQRTTIYVDEIAGNTNTIALNNFVLGGEMPIGNIVIKNISATNENGVKNFATEQVININPGDDDTVEWYGPMLGEIPVKLTGKMTDYKLYCNIDIDMGQIINVVFGNQELTGIENIVNDGVEKTIYDITGRRVEAVTTPGIYIVNGKKVVVR